MDCKLNNQVSVIIPCYNAELYIRDAVNSVLNQTYSNIEIVCVNDGSTDNSAQIIKEYADKYKNILFFNEKINRGVCYSRNLGIEASRGEYILLLDADDKIEPGYVEENVNILNDMVVNHEKNFTVKNKLMFRKRDYFQYNKV